MKINNEIINNYKNIKLQIEKFYDFDEDIRDELHTAFFEVLKKKDPYNLCGAMEFLTIEGVAPFNDYAEDSIEFKILKNVFSDEYFYWIDLYVEE